MRELKIPWSGLKINARPGTLVMVSVLVNDNDGKGRKAVLE